MMQKTIRYWAGVLLLLLPGVLAAAEPAKALAAADVRVLVDISGSMKNTDPEYLRRPAVDLLLKLFPQQSRVGVWTFAQDVNVLVPYGDVTDRWRKAALPKSRQIGSTGLFTHIGAALEAGVKGAAAMPGSQVNLLLLTDGKVDISKDPAANTAERERILNEVLPALKAAGVRVHTVALSADADHPLLDQLSVSTGGISAVAATAEELMPIFLRAFDVAVPSEQVPLNDRKFLIDNQVQEFTALIFRDPKGNTTLQGPDGKRYSRTNAGEKLRWHSGDNYDLITISAPTPGEWEVLTDIKPASRITVVSNFSMASTRLDTNLYVGDAPALEILFQDGDKPIADPELLKLLEISSAVAQGEAAGTAQQLAARGSIPAGGRFTGQLPPFAEAGQYSITLKADGTTFQRQLVQHVTVRELFAQQVQDAPDGQRTLTVSAVMPVVDEAASELSAELKYPDGKRVIEPMKTMGGSTWFLPLATTQAGRYEVRVEARGKLTDGRALAMSLPALSVDVTAASAPAVPAAMPEAPEAQPVEPPVEEEGKGLFRWDNYPLIAGLVVVNLLLLAGGVLLFRRLRQGSRSRVLEDDANDNPHLDVPPPPAPVAAAGAVAGAAVAGAVVDDLLDDLPEPPSVASLDDDIIDIAPPEDDEDSLA